MTEQDAPRLFSLVDANRATLRKFWWEVKTQSPADSLAYIREIHDIEQKDHIPTRGVCVDDLLIGVTGLHTLVRERRSAAVGYWIDREHAGRGYAQAALKLLADTAFDDFSLRELTICTRAENEASRAIATRAGFRLTGIDTLPTWQESELVEVAHYSLQPD